MIIYLNMFYRTRRLYVLRNGHSMWRTGSVVLDCPSKRKSGDVTPIDTLLLGNYWSYWPGSKTVAVKRVIKLSLKANLPFARRFAHPHVRADFALPDLIQEFFSRILGVESWKAGWKADSKWQPKFGPFSPGLDQAGTTKSKLQILSAVTK